VTLVRGKDTLARVFVDNPEPGGFTDVEVTLTALTTDTDVGFVETLGQRTKKFSAPPTVIRHNEAHTANFHLPQDWVEKESLHLTAEVHRPNYTDTPDDRSVTEIVTFESVYDPTIHLVRLNERGATKDSDGNWSPGTGTIADSDDLEAVKDGFRNISPLADPTFYEHSPHDVGATGHLDDSEVLVHLNEYISNLGTVQETDTDGNVVTYPVDQFFGLTDRGPGLSDPSWSASNGSLQCFAGIGSNGKNLAAWGSVRRSGHREMVMAHELNHNIGPNTWGRHATAACDADGPDSNWASHPKNSAGEPFIGEVGWHPTHGVLPDIYPDVMSYCQDSESPFQWISVYRWENQIDRWNQMGPTPTYDRVSATRQGDSTARVISGYLYGDGSAELRPSFEVPGTATFPGQSVSNPQLRLLVGYTDGKREIPLFEPVETDADVERRPFTVRVPDNGEITSIALVDTETDETLAEYRASGFELTSAEIDVPGVFERDTEYEIDVTIDTDADRPLYRQLFYRSGSGQWKPRGNRFTDDTADVQFSREPGGSEMQFMLLVSDGVGTERAVSPTFELPPRPPEVTIREGAGWDVEVEGAEDETPDGDDGGATAGEPGDGEVTEIRNVSETVEASVGEPVTLVVRGMDQRQRDLPPENVEWTVENERGESVDVSGRAVGEKLLNRFSRPGTYTATVTGTDPETGLSATDDIEIEVAQPTLPNSETIQMLEEARGGEEDMDDEDDTSDDETGDDETGDNEDTTDDDSGGDESGDDEDTTDESTDEAPTDDTDGADGDGPGLGVLSALAGIGGAGYLARRLRETDDSEE
jgi:hypothetical protein